MFVCCVLRVSAEKPMLLLTNTEASDTRTPGSSTTSESSSSSSSTAAKDKDTHTSSTALITRTVPDFMVRVNILCKLFDVV